MEGQPQQESFIDTESGYRGSKEDDRSIRFIIMDHVRRVSSTGSQEMRGGYWKPKTQSMGGATFTTEVYVEDTREEYCNAIKILFYLVIAEAEAFPRFYALADSMKEQLAIIENDKK